MLSINSSVNVRAMKRYPIRAKERRTRNSQYVKEKYTPCVDCGFYHPACMDFHHLDPTTKVDSVARMIGTGRALKVIQEEIDKCVCLCSNCHRKRHHSSVVVAGH